MGLRYLSCLSVSQSVSQSAVMAASNGHNSEMTSSIEINEAKGWEALHSPMLFHSKAYGRNMKLENGAIFTKKCGDKTVDLHVQTKVPAGRKAMNKYYYMGHLHASCSLASYHRLEQILAADSAHTA